MKDDELLKELFEKGKDYKPLPKWNKDPEPMNYRGRSKEIEPSRDEKYLERYIK